ncbi:hypothetical protein LCGC14_0561820 [marine sediment metagenome]|uniref:Uncharacterized protein n=1 Tax=marine sediment metagenome TaxID=412755 RepID=A0A0F9RLP9_9ZZZZ
MTVKIIGARQLQRALAEVLQNIGDVSLVTSRLVIDMTKYAHIATGFLRGSIYHKDNIAGAKAPYAGFEADRGGLHDYAQRAINVFPVENYFDEIVRPF